MLPSIADKTPTGERILYAPKEVWRLFTWDHIPAAIYLGVAFPIAVTLLFPLAANADKNLVLAWSAEGLGMTQCYLFAESGTRISHFNLSWGLMLGAYVLFVVCCDFLLRQRRGFRYYMAFGVLLCKLLPAACAWCEASTNHGIRSGFDWVWTSRQLEKCEL